MKNQLHATRWRVQQQLKLQLDTMVNPRSPLNTNAPQQVNSKKKKRNENEISNYLNLCKLIVSGFFLAKQCINESYI